MKQKFDYVWNVGTLLMVLLLLVPIAGFTQNGTVKGTVVDSEGEPVIGATVTEKGRKGNGAITNLDGDFTLTLSGTEKKIIVTFIGMRTEEVSVTPGKKVQIVLEDDAQQLDEVEVVAIGYGNARRKDLTGAISSVGENTLKDITTTSAASAITGRIAGVSVVTTQGSPDAEVSIRVRGGGSITQSNDPLFIVDGFQVNGIGDIPPTDIESIDVLKDASSTAIYGAKGANGVVLVTTKSGRVGKMEVSLNASVGFNHMYNETDVLSPYEYVYLQRELDPSTNAGFFERYGRWDDLEIYRGRKGTNWQAKLFDRTGVKQNYNLNINGGSKDLVYSLSYTRDNEEYIMKTSEFNRDNLNVKISKKFNDKLKIDFNSRMTSTVIDGTSVSSGGKLRDCVKYPPVGTLKDLTAEDLQGSEYIPENISGLNDPFYNIANEYKKQQKFSNSYNAALIWDIIKGLNFRAEGTYVFDFDRTDQIYLENTGEANNKAGQPVSYRTYWNGKRWTGRTQLSYNKQIKKHRFDITAGLELSSSEKDNMRINSDYYPIDYTANDILSMWNNGKAEPTYTTIDEPNRSQSYFGRMGYNLNNRYYANFTLRADGTNVFAPGNKWGVFPAGSVAWRISDEKFMKTAKNWLSDLKLRLSYGKAGNARVGSRWRQTYKAVSDTRYLYYQNETGMSSLQTSTTLRNEDLTWESKYSANIGLDMSLFKNRLKINVDLYKDITKNLIMSVQLPSNAGYRDQYQNLGQTTNQEISLNANLIQKKDAYLDFGFNISFNKNKVDALYGANQDVMILSAGGTSVGSDNYRIFVGQEVGLMYGYIYDGLYDFDDFTFNKETQRWDLNEGVVDCSGVLSLSGNYYGPGHMKLKDLNGDGKIDPDNDRKVIGHALPKHTGGFNINAGWKGFDLVAMFNWSYGNDILNLSKVDYVTYAGSRKYQNMSTLMKKENRFTTIDPVTGLNIYNGGNADPERLREVNQNKTMWHPIINNNITTDWVVEDGSFLRLGTLTLGYTLPKNLTKKFGVKKLRLYATASNLFCLTGYSGQDPEVNTSSSNMTPGVDKSSYPKNKNYLFGVNLTF
jgi:TonB-linked SusC/RagA family outer membrane protein